MTYPKTDANGRLSTQEIVRLSEPDSIWQSGGWKKEYAHLHSALSNGNKFRMMRSGNNLFVLRIIRPQETELSIINADPQDVFLKHFEVAIRCLLHAGYKWFYIVMPDFSLFQKLEQMGIPVKVEKEKKKNKKGQILYRGTVDLRNRNVA
jgi:hypothetical protein